MVFVKFKTQKRAHSKGGHRCGLFLPFNPPVGQAGPVSIYRRLPLVKGVSIHAMLKYSDCDDLIKLINYHKLCINLRRWRVFTLKNTLHVI